MKEKIKSAITTIFGTQNNIIFKLSFSFFITGVLFLIFAIGFQSTNNSPQVINTFSTMAGISFALWIISTQSNNSIYEIGKELFRLFIFFMILVFSLYFCSHSIFHVQGFKLIIGSMFSFIGLLSCSFYFVSKFVDIFNFVKKLINQINRKLFSTIQNGETEQKATKFKAFVENITTFLVSIAGLGVAIKAIVEPIINLIQTLFKP